MDRRCDLHVHSTYSDGTVSPEGIVKMAEECGLSAVALTDHNTVCGLPAFWAAARNSPVEAISGVEISSGYRDKEVHIVGLFLKPERLEPLEALLGLINRRKEESNRALVRKLNQAGFALCYDAIREGHQGNINRAVLAREMQKLGYIREIQEGIRGPLSAKNGYYVPPERIPALEAIGLLKKIGAVPVLAHPYLNFDNRQLAGFLPEAKEAGLAAMETRYPLYAPETAAAAVRTAARFSLLESGGSDFHGTNKPDIRLGSGRGSLEVPYRFAEKLRDAAVSG